MKQAVKLTVDEFIEEYSKLPDGWRYELKNGEVVEVSPDAAPYHGEIQAVVLWLLGNATETMDGVSIYGPTNVQLVKDSLGKGPDVTVVTNADKVRNLGTKLLGAPSLVVEIVSPNRPHLDLVEKRALYTDRGVREIWFLDSRTREALFLCRIGSKYKEFRLANGIFTSRSVKGLKVDVAALFDLDRKRLRKAAGL